MKELNPLHDLFWQRLGKFFKRLGPIVPIASWACYLMPSLSSGRSLQVFYLFFVFLTGYFCFVHPRNLEQKLEGQLYAAGSRQNHQKKLTVLIDAFFIGLITFSLACLMCIMIFRLPATPLYELLLSEEPFNLPTTIISVFSVVVAALRYDQKYHALSLKMNAYSLHLHRDDLRVDLLNRQLHDVILLKHRVVRVVCDCLVVFYNIFFVGFSLGMMFFSAQLQLLLRGLFIWKMIGISSLMTARISYANKKLSSDYLAEKLSAIARLRWDSAMRIFTAGDDSPESPANHL